jgi:hypothetical protein
MVSTIVILGKCFYIASTNPFYSITNGKTSNKVNHIIQGKQISQSPVNVISNMNKSNTYHLTPNVSSVKKVINMKLPKVSDQSLDYDQDDNLNISFLSHFPQQQAKHTNSEQSSTRKRNSTSKKSHSKQESKNSLLRSESDVRTRSNSAPIPGIRQK